MVKRYTPDTKIEDYCHPYETYTVAVMKESSTGQWVKLETYENVVATAGSIERKGNNHA